MRLRLLILLATLGCGCGNDKPRNVLLISMDSLRSDRLNSSGYTIRRTSPELDRIAKEGVQFDFAYSNAPWTIPSHMSLFTSLFPSAHGFNLDAREMVDSPPVLSTGIRTLAETLRAGGYRTAAFSDGGPLEPRFGFDRGFQVFRRPEEGAKLSLEQICEEALEWVLTNQRKPFFLFLHTFEVHQPYADPGREGLSLEEVKSEGYDLDIKHTDSTLGRNLFKILRRCGLWDETILIVTSDHGEALFERLISGRGDDHGYHLYDETLHVPLIFLLPGGKPQESVVETPVQLVDVMPTILSLVGLETDGLVMQGQNLMPLMEGGKLPDRALFAEAPFQGPGWGAVRLDRFKFILSPRIQIPAERETPVQWWIQLDLPERALYDLSADPEEERNLFDQLPRKAAKMEAALVEMWEGSSKVRSYYGEPGRRSVDPDLLKYLRSLGYIQ